MELNYNVLWIEYDGFMTDNENKNKTINETTKTGWEKGKTFKGLKDKTNDK